MEDQKVTGAPGSPSATTSLDGKQLPPLPPIFGGVIKDSAKDSTPWWAPSVVPPKGAPNVLLIMTDDQGYGVSSTFGGVIHTPSAHHRPQPSLGRLRRNRRTVHRFPRLRFRHQPGESHRRHHPSR